MTELLLLIGCAAAVFVAREIFRAPLCCSRCERPEYLCECKKDGVE